MNYVGIKHFVMILHFDLPQALEEKYGGYLNHSFEFLKFSETGVDYGNPTFVFSLVSALEYLIDELVIVGLFGFQCEIWGGSCHKGFDMSLLPQTSLQPALPLQTGLTSPANTHTRPNLAADPSPAAYL
ncbi:putative glycoside hydrolase superfamily [Rosa chinensis]|uniref:Putative glycoside hydrolase superfamily n=1 Tax=Rosa chinensis TaxID=74649 RepID=A0A2P6P873_ROSCH|nr:putative glycoside hydrolase superfamily [Rosa chinensis]